MLKINNKNLTYKILLFKLFLYIIAIIKLLTLIKSFNLEL